MKTVAIIIARMGSSRLPGKVLMDLGGKAVLGWVVDAAIAVPAIDEVVVATTTEPRDDAIVGWVNLQRAYRKVSAFRGSEDDVLERVYQAAKAAKATTIIRLTADCPFHDPHVIAEIIALREATNSVYASNVDPPTWPDGMDCEAFTFNVLSLAHEHAKRPSDRNTVTQYIQRHFAGSKANLSCPLPGMHKERWVLDTGDDYELCKKIAECEPKSWIDIKRYLDSNPGLRELNVNHPRNERFLDELVADEPVDRSHQWLGKVAFEEAKKIIPLAAQTFSKSHLQFPKESPLFASYGDGGKIYDMDGNDFIDLTMGLLPVILGYRDPDINFAIRQQLDRGISLSWSTELEYTLAEMLVELIPCADMARLAKNGTDVTQAAVRLARFATGRDHFLSSGYHGWDDIFIGRDPLRCNGVPTATAQLMYPIAYGDSFAIDLILRGSYACIVIEPETNPEYLRTLRAACDRTGTLLIFDEIITGFRFDLGGAQKLWGVTPDLATFGKSMGNGMPISAIVGKREYMKLMDQVCFSGTFFGEALSLSAAIATITKLKNEDVLPKIHAKNKSITLDIMSLQRKYGLNVLEIAGDYLPRINFLPCGSWTSSDVRTFFMQGMLKHGVLVIASLNLCHAHDESDLARVRLAAEATFQEFAKALKTKPVLEAVYTTVRGA